MTIRTKVTLGVLIVATILSAVFSAINFYREKRAAKGAQQERLSGIELRLGQSLPPLLYDFSIAQVAKSLSAEMHDPNIEALSVIDKKSAPISVWRRNERGEPVEQKELPGGDPTSNGKIVYGQGQKAEELGSFQIYLDDRLMNEKIHRQLSVAFLQAVLLDVSFILLIALLMRTFVSQPLSGLSSIVARIATGDLSQTIPEWLEIKSDEIGTLARAVKALNDNLKGEVLPAFEALADGDFTFVAQGVISRPLNRANEKLRATIETIVASAREVRDQSAEILRHVQRLTDGAVQQSESLEEITESMAGINGRIQVCAEKAGRTTQMASTARTSAESGTGQMSTMVEAISNIKNSSDEISKMVSAVNDIAFQTNLLALNAAVEAARAGSKGKGFGVVAEEVRHLATRSAKAVKEIEEMLSESEDRVNKGSSIAEVTSSSFNSIAKGTIAMTDLVDDISDMLREQSQSITQVYANLNSVEIVTRQNSLSSKEVADAVDSLSQKASDLENLLSQFQLD